MFIVSQSGIKHVRPVFTKCQIAGALNQYYRNELDFESALVFFEHLPACPWCSALFRDAFSSDLQRRDPLTALMDSSDLTDEQREQALAMERVHGTAIAMDYVFLMHQKNQA